MNRSMRSVLVAGSVVVAGAGAMAQHAATPVSVVDQALGHEHAIARRAQRNTANAPHDWDVPVTTARGSCYEVIGLAQGPSRVSVEIHARQARIGDAVSIATQAPNRARFCAELPGHVYSVFVHADGPTDWALAVHGVAPEPPAPDPGTSARERLATALANGSTNGGDGRAAADAGAAPPSNANDPVGGVENDFVGGQIRSTVHGDATHGLVPAERVTLGENQSHEVALALVGGHCVLAVAAGVPSLTDVNLEITDPAGNRVAQDAGHHGTESLRYCPPYSGTYRLTVRAFAGFGLTGIQAFEVR